MNKDLILANSLDFNNLESFYYYIYESWLVGQSKQSKELFKSLCDKKTFLDFIEDNKTSYNYIDYKKYIPFLHNLLID